MNWEDEGFLLQKRKFRENASIANFFTYKYGKISGIIYGGTSRKLKNYLQVGNKLFLIHNSTKSNKSGYLKVEIMEADELERLTAVDIMTKNCNNLLSKLLMACIIAVTVTNNCWSISIPIFFLSLVGRPLTKR